jgi:hypothetical protein
MVIRVAIRETESAERLVEEFASLFGGRQVTLRSSGEIELKLRGEANGPLSQALQAIVRRRTLLHARAARLQTARRDTRASVRRPKPRPRSRPIGRAEQAVKRRPVVRRVTNSVYDAFVKLGCEDGEFWCECDDPSCEETVTLTLREYAALNKRADEPLLSHSHTAGQAASADEPARV